MLVIPDVTKRATEDSRARLADKMAQVPPSPPHPLHPHLQLPLGTISEEELATNKEKTNRHLRLSELLQEHSSQAELIVM